MTHTLYLQRTVVSWCWLSQPTAPCSVRMGTRLQTPRSSGVVCSPSHGGCCFLAQCSAEHQNVACSPFNAEISNTVLTGLNRVGSGSENAPLEPARFVGSCVRSHGWFWLSRSGTPRAGRSLVTLVLCLLICTECSFGNSTS